MYSSVEHVKSNRMNCIHLLACRLHLPERNTPEKLRVKVGARLHTHLRTNTCFNQRRSGTASPSNVYPLLTPLCRSMLVRFNRSHPKPPFPPSYSYPFHPACKYKKHNVSVELMLTSLGYIICSLSEELTSLVVDGRIIENIFCGNDVDSSTMYESCTYRKEFCTIGVNWNARRQRKLSYVELY